ncbi:peptidylprolyl isomerase [Rasiella rasia]|uniref:Peptidyl-prolyl cis-trans isomerase n=1 Tax=Rasiella rasia TaxID=2744027 RepID=A0A6G6GI78_9FLAO|nr:peptidylprolyl isomerase [Rasiella rasia]QIE58123.1 peptidylprolyl isomerase [Rasiella rasia]
MRVLLALGILVCFVSSCEDTKKTSVEKTKTTSVIDETTTSTNDSSSQEISEVTLPEYPKITEENVVEFLTQYGQENPETEVKITTRLGTIYMSLYEDTPLHRANFIYLVKSGYFSDTFFHRTVPKFIIQGGNSDLPSTNKKRADIGATYLLPAEINGRNHSYGSVSGAKEYRENPDKKTMPFEFFIFLGPQTSTKHLNGNYTVFGKITKGMSVVEKIAVLETDEGEWPLQNVYITAEIVK